MGIREATDEFAVRYYRWALEDSHREIQEEFPLLRKVRSRDTLRLLSIMQPLVQEQRAVLATALVKRFHPRGVEVAREYPTSEEKNARERYFRRARIPTPAELQADEQVQSGKPYPKVRNKKLITLAKEELQPILGDSESWGRRQWRYTSDFGNWTVHTYVEVGGLHSQLWYRHTIAPPDRYTRLGEASVDKSAIVYWAANSISLLSWLGITSQTCWDLLTESDIPEAAEALSLLCSHFMQAVPDLLEGLVLD